MGPESLKRTPESIRRRIISDAGESPGAPVPLNVVQRLMLAGGRSPSAPTPSRRAKTKSRRGGRDTTKNGTGQRSVADIYERLNKDISQGDEDRENDLGARISKTTSSGKKDHL